MVTSRSDCGNGSGRSRMELVTAKMARFAPRQIATVANAVTVNAGALRSWRRAKRRLFMSFSAQRLHRIDQCGAAGGQQAREQRDYSEQHRGSAEQHGVVGRHFKELRRK